MTILVVQKTSTSGGNPTTTLGVSLASITNGNSIIISSDAQNAGGNYQISTVVDNQSGNTFAKAVQTNSTGIGANAEIWWCPAVNYISGTYTVTVTYSGGTAGIGLGMMEVSGLGTSVDQIASVNDGGVQGTSASLTGATNTNANDLCVATLAANYNATANTDPPASTGAAFTSWYQITAIGGRQEAGYKILSAIEASNASWTWTAAVNYCAVMATFMGAGGAINQGQSLTTGTFQAMRIR